MIKNIKLFITSILVLFVYKIYAKEFTYNSQAPWKEMKSYFSRWGENLYFKHSGGFETNIDKYGKYQCKGSILYDNNSSSKICILPANLIKMVMFL